MRGGGRSEMNNPRILAEYVAQCVVSANTIAMKRYIKELERVSRGQTVPCDKCHDGRVALDRVCQSCYDSVCVVCDADAVLKPICKPCETCNRDICEKLECATKHDLWCKK